MENGSNPQHPQQDIIKYPKVLFSQLNKKIIKNHITRIDITRIKCYNTKCKEVERMTFKELEKLLKADGWVLKDTKGSHFQYTNPNKPGKVTVPNHKGDIPKGTANSILKQAGLR